MHSQWRAVSILQASPPSEYPCNIKKLLRHSLSPDLCVHIGCVFVSTDDERVGVRTGTLGYEPIVWARGLSLKCVGLGRDPRVRGDGRLGTFTGEILADIPSIRNLDLWTTDGKLRDANCDEDLWGTGAPLYNIRKRGDVTVRLRLAFEQGLPVFCMIKSHRLLPKRNKKSHDCCKKMPSLVGNYGNVSKLTRSIRHRH